AVRRIRGGVHQHLWRHAGVEEPGRGSILEIVAGEDVHARAASAARGPVEGARLATGERQLELLNSFARSLGRQQAERARRRGLDRVAPAEPQLVVLLPDV